MTYDNATAPNTYRCHSKMSVCWNLYSQPHWQIRKLQMQWSTTKRPDVRNCRCSGSCFSFIRVNGQGKNWERNFQHSFYWISLTDSCYAPVLCFCCNRRKRIIAMMLVRWWFLRTFEVATINLHTVSTPLESFPYLAFLVLYFGNPMSYACQCVKQSSRKASPSDHRRTILCFDTITKVRVSIKYHERKIHWRSAACRLLVFNFL